VTARGWLACIAAYLATSAACRPAAPAAPERRSEAALPAGRLPARLRRLSNSEYTRTLSRLLGFTVTLPESFPEDVRVDGFSANARQGVDPSYLAEALSLTRGLGHRAATEHFSELVPCEPSAADCDRQFVAQFSERAYRRRPSAAEIEAGLALFRASGPSFEAGVEQLVATLLVSPELLYVSELGTQVAPGLRRLTSEEAASVLAYLLTGGPPDAALAAAAAAGRLADAGERARQAWRLLAQSETRFQFRRFVREWLGLDALARLTKPVADDRQLRQGLLAETDAFIDEVFMYEGASLDRLLLANFTVLPASLHAFEGLPPAAKESDYGRVSLAGSARLGLLQQPSFLAVTAHESESAPVLRGKAVLERLLCVKLPRPTELGIIVTFPPTDPAQTTRQRHQRHSQDPTCRSCHRTIDALGYPFENFDFIGRARTEENQLPVDTHTEYDGPGGPQSFRDSTDVARWLAKNPRAHECFARQAYRFFSGDGAGTGEAAFLALRAELPEARQRDLFETLVAYISSPLFLERSTVEARP
jgi:Protein of unknown function (DUF1588)/Protein of unknown function (DUF1592)/Protein of unknown function (DUF1595)/Protein of unknown function (DUF1587)